MILPWPESQGLEIFCTEQAIMTNQPSKYYEDEMEMSMNA